MEHNKPNKSKHNKNSKRNNKFKLNNNQIKSRNYLIYHPLNNSLNKIMLLKNSKIHRYNNRKRKILYSLCHQTNKNQFNKQWSKIRIFHNNKTNNQLKFSSKTIRLNKHISNKIRSHNNSK